MPANCKRNRTFCTVRHGWAGRSSLLDKSKTPKGGAHVKNIALTQAHLARIHRTLTA
jgi:hypothetical protein